MVIMRIILLGIDGVRFWKARPLVTGVLLKTCNTMEFNSVINVFAPVTDAVFFFHGMNRTRIKNVIFR